MLAIIEAILALLCSGVFTLRYLLIYTVLIGLLWLRNKYSSFVTPLLMFYTSYYCSINCLVNSVDFFYNNLFMGLTYYNDEAFLHSFSYKVHQASLCLILAFISAQLFAPTIEQLRKVPEGLALMFGFSFMVCLSMFFCFLFELTWFSPGKR